MKKMKVLLSSALILSMVACNNTTTEETKVTITDTTKQQEATPQSPDMHNAQNALDWNGTYEGMLPCASCEGIKSTVVLNEDNTYSRVDEYKGGKKEEKFEEKGKFTWDSTGTKITLEVADGMKPMYLVTEGSIIMLDADGKENTGELASKYILKKIK